MYGSVNTPPADMAQLADDNVNKGIVTKAGTTIGFIDGERAAVFIETAGANRLLLDDDAEKIEITDQHGNVLTMDQDGIVMTSVKDVVIEASGKVEIKGAEVDVN